MGASPSTATWCTEPVDMCGKRDLGGETRGRTGSLPEALVPGQVSRQGMNVKVTSYNIFLLEFGCGTPSPSDSCWSSAPCDPTRQWSSLSTGKRCGPPRVFGFVTREPRAG